ncbi:MAG: hypothetical protein OQJ76_10035, partial [Rhodospirillales bacterium]|nr:hypothetical protein [Rhodospirillales bacterium]
MTLTSVTLRPYSLPLRKAWVTAKGVITERVGWLVIAGTAKGRLGYGDCAPLPSIGTETMEEAGIGAAALGQLQGLSVDKALNSIDGLPPALKCGVETALLDLAAQAKGIPLAKTLNPAAARSVNVNAVIGTADTETPGQAEKAGLLGFRVLKIKVGIHDRASELPALRATASRLPEGVTLRLDANGAWTMDQARLFFDGIETLPIESVEDPLRDPTPGSLAGLQ